MKAIRFVLLSCLPLFASAGAQTPQQPAPQQPQKQSQPARGEEVGEDEVLHVDTSLVGVPVTVLDRDGRFVSGLKKEDFHVLEDGAEQQIAYFAPAESNVTVMLLFDRFVENYRETAEAFVRQLRAGDTLIVARFGDPKYDTLTVEGDAAAGARKSARRGKWRFGVGVHDAVAAAVRRMNAVEGRKAIVLFTNGLLPEMDEYWIQMNPDGSLGRLLDERTTKAPERTTARATLNEAEESDAPFYVMKYDTRGDEVRNGPTPGKRYREEEVHMLLRVRKEFDDADKYLQALADKSGGRLFTVPYAWKDRARDRPDLTQQFAQVCAELRQQYSLGYYTKHANEPDTRHEIKVRVSRPDLAVRARTNYTPAPPKK